MALSIKDPEADRLARELARRTGELLTVAVRQALREKIQKLPRRGRRSLEDRLNEIGRRAAALAGDDPRTADEIIGYDENGLPR